MNNVEERIRATLHAVADNAYDDDDVALAEIEVVSTSRQRASTNLARVAVAIVVVCLIATTAFVATGRGSAVDIRSVLDVSRLQWQTTTGGPLLAPTWLPPGMKLFEMRAGPTIQPPAGKGTSTQLFETIPTGSSPSQAFAVSTIYAPGVSLTEPSITVRGYPASVERDKGVRFDITWTQPDDLEIDTTFRGMTKNRAVAALNALRARSRRPLDGFDPTSAPSGFRLAGESHARPASDSNADLRYARSASPANLGLTSFIVRTNPAGDTSDYLWNAVEHPREADGSVEPSGSVSNGNGSTDHYVEVLWPDGRSVSVTSSLTGIDDANLRRVARSARTLDAHQAEQLRATIDHRLTKLPVWTRATIDGAELELRGSAQPLAVCLRLGNQPPTCELLQGPAGPGIGGAVVAGQWVVFAAQATTPDFFVDGHSFHPYQIVVRGWHFALGLPGPHATNIEVRGSGDSSTDRPGR